ncbi:hypothetical protein EFD62_14410 [Acetivibrio mesophilus]|uniref:Uncharacterized protein n=1 Tax=Acetivibrio mesophilus TaxID=2487273 RepID=A0A4Q0I1L0_9FIRM|nr:hypothetical protein A7W90_14095 [Clostridium sp. Bc-iso-3]RXE58053.1 hypothetical protein EFD62_14410 [Acetivibrio mesophilus]
MDGVNQRMICMYNSFRSFIVEVGVDNDVDFTLQSGYIRNIPTEGIHKSMLKQGGTTLDIIPSSLQTVERVCGDEGV